MLNHGIFEIRQGFTATGGYFIEAIGPADRFWVNGTEGAFTIIPSILITGIIVMILGIALILFAMRYLSVPRGASILLGFFVLLTLFGGGLGHLVVFLPTWGFATRIHAPLHWFENTVPESVRSILVEKEAFLLVYAEAWIDLVVYEIIGGGHSVFGSWTGFFSPF